jgi:hypothetical protein
MPLALIVGAMIIAGVRSLRRRRAAA